MRSVSKATILSISSLMFLASCRAPLSPTTWTDDQETKISTAANQISLTEIQSVLSDLEGVRNVTINPDLSTYQNAIVSRLASYGLQTTTMEVNTDALWTWSENEGDYVVEGDFTMENLIGTKLGSDPSLAPVLVTAHWDTVANSTGIDDNASGVAGVLETARCVQEVSFKRTVIFVLFALEEVWFLGSQAYMDSLIEEPHAVINFEMIGFTSPDQIPLPITSNLIDFSVPPSDGIPTTGDFIAIIGNDVARNLGLDFCRSADVFSPDLKYYLISTDRQIGNNPLLGDLDRSDQSPFWGISVPALMITDTADFRVGTPYHTAEDTVDKIDFTFMTRVIQASIATVCVQAGVE